MSGRNIIYIYIDSYTFIQPRVFINFLYNTMITTPYSCEKIKKITDTNFLFSFQGWVACRVINITTATAGSLSVTFTRLNASPRKQIMPAETTPVHWRKDSAHIGKYNASHYRIFYQNKKPIWNILRTDKNNNFEFTIKLLMTLDRSYIGYLGFLGIDLLKSVLMHSNGAICLIKLLFKMGLFTVWCDGKLSYTPCDR